MSAKRFRIAFSFAGEKRDFVAKVADILAKRFGQDRILYDKYHEAEFARYDLGIYLPTLYGEQSDLIIPVLCADYDKKRWTGWEWVHIYGLLTRTEGNRVMPCRFDCATADGLSPTAGFIELDRKTPGETAALILERLALNEGKPRDHYKGASCQPDSQLGSGRSVTPPAAASIIQRVFACEFREFRGRSAELGELERQFRDPKRAGVVICAIGGMGKTAFANRFLTTCGIERFFDVVVGASAKAKSLDVSVFDWQGGRFKPSDHAIRTVRDYLVEIARELDAKDPSALPNDKLEDEIRSAIHGRRALLLLDNLETLDETTAALHLLRRLCSPPDQKFLITTRELPDTPGQGVAPIMLKRLQWEDAHALVRDLLEDLDPDVAKSLSEHNDAVAAILNRADGHPLALRLLTGKLWAQGENAILTMGSRSQQTSEENWGKDFFSFVFDKSLLAHLGPVAVDVACVIASHPQGVPEHILVEACQAGDSALTPAILEDATRRLRLTFCVHREHVDGVAVVAMHALTREFFAGLANAGDSLDKA